MGVDSMLATYLAYAYHDLQRAKKSEFGPEGSTSVCRTSHMGRFVHSPYSRSMQGGGFDMNLG